LTPNARPLQSKIDEKKVQSLTIVAA